MSATHASGPHFDPSELRSPERLARLEMDRVVETSLRGIKPRTCLDIGTGTGIAAEALAARGLACTGLDASGSMLCMARAAVPTAAFVQAPLDHLPFCSGSFDLLYMGHVLHEAPDTGIALREARRLARLRVAVLEWPYEEVDRSHGPPLKRRLSVDQVREFGSVAGFDLVQVFPLAHNVLFLLDTEAASAVAR